jgi:hypothetical protein
MVMDLVELRVLAVGGIMAVGVVVSSLAVGALAVVAWIGRISDAWEARLAGQPTADGRADLRAGRAPC